jgi:hypothetical protein
VVKLLDLGWRRLPGPKARPRAARTAAQTQLAADTTPGTVLGTVGYMSPEQVRGLPTDHRTDIFSFGAVFYEMLTGRRPFRGDSHVETMNAILKEDPAEFTDVAANVPGSVERIIRRCLEKQPADRFHSAHDLAISLEALSGSSNSNQSSASIAAAALAMPVQEKGRRLNPTARTAALVVVGAAGLYAGRAIWAPPPSTVTEFQRLTYRRGPIFSAAMAPDGATFVYSARWEGSPRQNLLDPQRESRVAPPAVPRCGRCVDFRYGRAGDHSRSRHHQRLRHSRHAGEGAAFGRRRSRRTRRCPAR